MKKYFILIFFITTPVYAQFSGSTGVMMIKKYLSGQPTVFIINNSDGTRTVETFNVESRRYYVKRDDTPYSDGTVITNLNDGFKKKIVYNEPGYPEKNIAYNGDIEFTSTCRYVRLSSVHADSDVSADTDGDGCPDIFDSAPNDPSYSNCEQPNPDCQVDSDGDGVMDCEDPAPNDPTYPKEGDINGDGLLDEFDPYPEDDLPFQYRIVKKQDSTGAFTIVTNRGDYITYGQYDDSPYTTFGEGVTPWKNDFNLNEDALSVVYDPEQPFITKEGSTTNWDFQDYSDSKENQDIQNNAPPTPEPEIKDNEIDASNETNRMLDGLIDTLKHEGTASRKKLDEIGDGITNLGRKIDSQDNSGIENRLDDLIESSDDINENLENFSKDSDSKLSEFENVSVSDFYNSDKFSGEIVEGEDFEAITPLSNETFIQEFFSNNPVLSALSSSKIETENPKCNFTLVTSLGTHDMDLCFLESGFNKAGVILLSITTLFSLFVVVKK
jgi:hypothetical protein